MTGGAAIAANRLLSALSNNGINAKMLVRDKTSDNLRVTQLKGKLTKTRAFVWERWCIFSKLHFSKKHLFELDIANGGFDITSLPEFQEADIIHLHWINQGMLSLDNIHKIVQSGKPIVWTMHDFWPATAICHYPHDCQAFTHNCCNCPYLPNGGSQHDLAAKIWAKKQAIWQNANISFVACSKWLADLARESALLNGKTVVNIPNPIDTKLFCPADKTAARKSLGLPLHKRLILFVSQRITDQRKGMDFFIEACQKLVADHPDASSNTAVVILGAHAEDFAESLALPVHPLGYISDTKKIIDIYRAVDTFVLPSLEDNLPNTIMEAMACGVPCVGFNTGGIPEMIDHTVNGYVADYRNSDDLAHGIHWIINSSNYTELSQNALAKVRTNYSQAEISRQYLKIYKALLN